MRRLVSVLALSLAGLSVSAQSTPRAVVSEMAASLTAASPWAFIRLISREAPQREDLSTKVQALVTGYEISSSIEILSESEEGASAKLELDWYLKLTSRGVSPSLVQRRERVQVSFERKGKNWRVTLLEPVALFALP